jgi:hypothetical protein
MLSIAIFWGLTLFCLGGCALALVRGGVAERLAAGVIILNIALGYGVMQLFPTAANSFRLVNDGLAAVALLVLAVRYAAPWLGGAMFFYTAQFALHSYYLVLGLSSDTLLHANLNNLNFVGVICCLIVGTEVAWRRRVRLSRLDAAAPPAA